MYLQAGRPVRAFRPFGDVFDVVTGFFDSDLGGAVLKVGTGLASTYLNTLIGPNQSQAGQQQQYFPLYAPYSAQPGILPQNVVTANPATTQQPQQPANVSSTAQDFTPYYVAGAVVLAVLILR